MTGGIANRWTALAAAAAVWSGAARAWACPSCNQALEGDPAALAFYWSTLFMIAMPYLMVLAVGGGVALIYRRAARDVAPLDELEHMTWSGEGPEKEGGR